MDNETLQRLQKIAQQSPYNQQQAVLAKQLEQLSAATKEPSAPVHYVPFKKPSKKKGTKAKRPSRNPQVHQYAERVRRMTDEQIWAEGHKEPTQAVVEYVIKEIHEDLLSVLAPHFGDDIMAKIDEVLGNWYHVKTGHLFSGDVKEGGIDRPLTENDKTQATGPFTREAEQQELEAIRKEVLEHGVR